YQLLRNTDNWIESMTATQTIPNKVHFIMSVLI
nr:type I-F CRISPR-associated protein Csy3 [Vibrio anguillarum]